MTTTPPDIAALVKGLSNPQRAAILRFGDGLHDRRDIHTTTWASLYRVGMASHILAGGHMFFTWTDLGQQVRAALKETPHAE